MYDGSVLRSDFSVVAARPSPMINPGKKVYKTATTEAVAMTGQIALFARVAGALGAHAWYQRHLFQTHIRLMLYKLNPRGRDR